MVFKQKDSQEAQVRALELRIKQSRDAQERGRLDKTLGMLRAGEKGEAQSAYHIDFLLKESPNWAVIHDLRIELNDRVAQIDHILINRFLEIYVIESKSFRKKIRYSNGGWERLNSENYWQGTRYCGSPGATIYGILPVLDEQIAVKGRGCLTIPAQ